MSFNKCLRCAEICATVRGSEEWKPVKLGERVCLRYPDGSGVQSLVSLFIKVVLDKGPAPLCYLTIGARCSLFEVVCTDVILSEENDGMCRLGW